MIDTQVLSFAIATEPAVDDKIKRYQRDCAALIGGMAEVRVCSIVVLEILRGPPSVVAKVRSSGILDLLQVEAVDRGSAEEAARILEAARSDDETCARCLNMRRATPCPACKQLVSHQQKTHDALIIATAARLADVEVLYTYDPGVLELAKFVKNLRAEAPPDLDGPLFATRRSP
jgi:predicted nucleic acid-binding protein